MPENNITFGFTIHYADCCGNAKNCIYPHTATATTEEEIRKIVAHDHVLAEFKDVYRSKDNFVRALVASMDCDNDHSENPNEWIAPKDIPHMFPNIPCVIVTSRNHMKPKGCKAAVFLSEQSESKDLAAKPHIAPTAQRFFGIASE